MPLPSSGDMLVTRAINENFSALKQKLDNIETLMRLTQMDINEIKAVLVQTAKNQDSPAEEKEES